MSRSQVPDYLAIGHIAIDVRPDGSLALGGAALYSALLAARFGLHAAILTRGRFSGHSDAIDSALSALAGEIDIIVQDAPEATSFTNVTRAGRRQQTLNSWAGEIDLNGAPGPWRASRIIHLAPIAQEIDARRAGRLSPQYFGVTPQGWMRRWEGERSGRVSLIPLRVPYEFLGRIDGLVLSSEEHTLARDEIELVGVRSLVAITRAAAGAYLVDRGHAMTLPAYTVPVIDDTGAGDVYAATLFTLRAEQVPTITAARSAAAASALLIQAGGPEHVPGRADVEAFLARQVGRPGIRR